MNEFRFLSPEQAAKTYDYLRSLSERYATITVWVQSLFARSCLATYPDFSFDLQQVGKEASSVADAILSASKQEQLGLDPLLIVETYLMLRKAGCDVPQLATLTKRIATELAMQSKDIRSRGRVRLIASRLSYLGYAVDINKPRAQVSALVRSTDNWLALPSSDLSEIVDHLFADSTVINEINSQILSLVALGELRNYKVDIGCKVLRLVILQGTFCDEATEALNYIAVQRRRNGGYGFVNPFTEETQEPLQQPLNIDLSLHLPMTLNAVWLFAIEATRRSDWKSSAIRGSG